MRGDCICLRRVSKCSMSVLAEGGRKVLTAGIAGRKGGSADAMPSNSASVRTARKVGAVPEGPANVPTIFLQLYVTSCQSRTWNLRSSETFFEDSYPFASRCLVSPLRTGYLRGGPALGGGLLYLVRAVLPAARCTRLASPPRAPGPACGAPLSVYSPTDTRNCYFVHADLYVASPHADGMHSHSLPVAALLAISAFAASSAKSRA